MRKIIDFVTNGGSYIRNLPIVLSLALCAMFAFVGVWTLSWSLNLASQLASSNLVVFVCVAAIVYLASRTDLKLPRSLFGIAVIAFTGFCMALLLSAVVGWIANVVNDARIILTIVASLGFAVGVYKDDLLGIWEAAHDRVSGNERTKGNN